MRTNRRSHVLAHLIRTVTGRENAVGAEVGVLEGDLSKGLLILMPKLSLYMVDPWLPYSERGAEYGGDRMTKAMATAMGMTDFASDRRVVIVADSERASRMIGHWSLDFAFIDARHDQASVHRDMELWYPKVRGGGLVAGHDYNMEEVRKAVDRFAQQYQYEVQQARDRMWWWRKRE